MYVPQEPNTAVTLSFMISYFCYFVKKRICKNCLLKWRPQGELGSRVTRIAAWVNKCPQNYPVVCNVREIKYNVFIFSGERQKFNLPSIVCRLYVKVSSFAFVMNM